MSIKYIAVKMNQIANSIFNALLHFQKIHDATYYVVLNFEGWSKH